MEIRKRYLTVGGKLYYAWECPRCIGGTMIVCQDRANQPYYFQCIACGKVVPIKNNKNNVEKPTKNEYLIRKYSKKLHKKAEKNNIKGSKKQDKVQ